MPYSIPTTEGSNEELQLLAIPEQKEFDGLAFPCALAPAFNDTFTDFDEFEGYVKSRKQLLERILFDNGAILFRDFPIKTAEDFDRFVKAFGREKYESVGGAAPRRIITGDVFTANEAPPNIRIPFHHELAQTPNPPNILFFYCDLPPKEDGETPLAVSNVVYRQMVKDHPEYVKRLETEGIRYVRVLPDGDDVTSAVGRGWQSTYAAETREEAEKMATKQGTEFEWTDDGCMKTVTKVLPAVRTDDRTRRKSWFNLINDAIYGWDDKRNDGKRSVLFGNGDTMDQDIMEALDKTLLELSVGVKWQQGDVIMIDNRQVLHSRATFTPPRRIYVCICH